MTLEELSPWLFSRTAGGVRWGLERTEELLAGVGDPHRHFVSVHVGGTNGKGSVAALSDAALRAAGRGRVGLYTSPHLVSFAERIRIDGTPIGAGALVAAAERLRPQIERTGATFFEATTAIAFLAFAEAGVEMAVVEVGLGGRLDATNVIRPEATAITNIALDHAEYLGDDLAGIAREKGGILKAGVPAVTGVTDPRLLEVLRGCAETVGTSIAPLDALATLSEIRVSADGTSFGLESRRWGDRRVQVGLAGAHQARNAALAAELLGMLPERWVPSWGAIEAGFGQVVWPGRLQRVKRGSTTYLFDVAHNAAGVEALLAALPALELPRPWVLLGGILSDKEWRPMLGPLLKATDAAILTVPSTAPASRRWDPAAAAAWAGDAGGRAPRVIPDLAAALERASTLAPHGTVIVTGSVHTVGDSMRHLGVSPDGPPS